MLKSAIFLLLTSTCAFGQSDQPEIKFKRFAIGINGSPDIAYRTLHNSDRESKAVWEKTKKNAREIYAPQFGYSVGGHILCNLTRNIFLEVGAQYSLKGYQRRPQLGVMAWGGEIFQGIMKDRYNFDFIDVPLTMNYVFLDKKRLQLIATVGFTWNHMRHNAMEHFVKEEVNDEFVPVLIFNTPYRENTFSGTVGFGIQYKVTESVFFRVVPTFRHAFKPIQTNLSESAFYWNAGVNFSCSFRLF